MPICPHCKESFKCKAKVCPNLIAQNQRKSLNGSIKKSAETFDVVEEYVLKLEKNTIIKTGHLINLFSLQMKTNGDLLRKTLENLVCRGILEKIKFGNGRSGHIYKVVFGTACPLFASAESGKGGACMFDWKNAKELDFDEGRIKNETGVLK